MIVERRPGRPRRPELRLPGAQGDPQGRRVGAAVADRPVRRHRAAAVRAAARPAGDGEDADRHRPRPRHLPRGRAARAGRRGAPRRAARPHRGRLLRRARPTGTRSPTSRRCSTSRCSATATSGRPTTRCAWSRRPAAPASSSAAAASAGPGCSPTWPPRSPGVPSARVRRCARSRRRCAGTPSCSREWAGSEQWGVTDFRKHVAWYLKGFAVGSEHARPRSRRRPRWPSSTTCSAGSTSTSRSRSPSSVSRAGARPALGASRCPTGWLDSRDSRAVPAGAETEHSGG